MYRFLIANRDDLIARCTSKFHARPDRLHTARQLANGVPMLLTQLTNILSDAVAPAPNTSQCDCHVAACNAESALRNSADAHGKAMLRLGYSVDDVVRNYGDLCQAITELAAVRNASFTVGDFGTLNRCLDEAIAGAVTAFSQERIDQVLRDRDAFENQRKGFLIHELRNALSTASFAIRAIEVGNFPLMGATGAVLKRSIVCMTELVSRSQDDVREASARERQSFSVAAFIADAEAAARLYTSETGATFVVPAVDADLFVRGNRERLSAALTNLLQNAFKFTRAQTAVTLSTSTLKENVLIQVFDQCGGLDEGSEQKMFAPFAQLNHDKSGLGLGLTIARQSVEADGGTLSVRNIPDVGCVFTISLPAEPDGHS